MLKLIFSLLLATWLFLQSVTLVHAQESGLVFADNFDHGLERWQEVRGSLLDWQVVDGWLQAELDHPYYLAELIPKPEYWQNSWQHYLFGFDFLAETNGDLNWSWGFQDQDNWYELHFFGRDWHLTRVKDGQQVLNKFGKFRLKTNQVYEVKIEFNHGLIKVWIDQQLLFEYFDHQFNGQSGPISLKATTGNVFPTKVKFDNVRVWLAETEPGKKIPLDEFKQTDPNWVDQEYDSASAWVEAEQPTIGRWGCALSSLAMILRYHDFLKLPDGQDLTPASLNQWLKHQPDGYVGQGAVNWLAGSRLSAVLAEKLSVIGREYRKLEFYRTSLPSISYIIEVLKQNRPAILQIPGHFLVTNGFSQEENDLYIVDPAYIYSALSQHQAEVFSVLDYKPSQTDLSAILLVYPQEVELSLAAEAGLFQDSLVDFSSEYDGLSGFLNLSLQPKQVQSLQIMQQISQPRSKSYSFQVENTSDNYQPIEIYAYDQQGNLMYFVNQVVPGKVVQLDLEFNKQTFTQTSVKLASQLDWQNISSLAAGWSNQNFRHRYQWFEFRQAATMALQVGEKLKARYEQWLLYLTSHYSVIIN